MPNRLATHLANTSPKITSYEQLEKQITQIQTVQGLTQRQQFVAYYRGQGSDGFKLVNGISRSKLDKEEVHVREKKVLADYFKKIEAKHFNFVQAPPQGVDKNWFAYLQAQHLGLKTRLMDWTKKWPIALLFAVNETEFDDEDGQFWVFMCPREQALRNSDTDLLNACAPPEVEQNYMINWPFYLSEEGEDNIAEKRRLRQHGHFFIQSKDKSTVPLEEQADLSPYLHKFIVDKDYKSSIRQELGNFTAEWAYYRQDADISEEIALLNKSFDEKV